MADIDEGTAHFSTHLTRVEDRDPAHVDIMTDSPRLGSKRQSRFCELSNPSDREAGFAPGSPILYNSTMIRMSVFYPATEGATFDHEYYRDKHVPLCLRTWNLDRAEIDKGLNGPYVAAVHFRFDSPEAMQAAMSSPDMGQIMGDIANYTTINPVIQTSEIV